MIVQLPLISRSGRRCASHLVRFEFRCVRCQRDGGGVPDMVGEPDRCIGGPLQAYLDMYVCTPCYFNSIRVVLLAPSGVCRIRT